jgi:predicted permease
MDIFLYILLHNIVPIIFIIGLGLALSKKFDLSIHTLSKLNFYIYVPFFIFMQIYTTELPSEMIKVLLFVVLLAILNSVIAAFVAKLRKYDEGFKNAFMNSVMFYNSGNIGIPLITLVFSSGPFLIDGKTPYLTLALTTQIVVLIFQNISTNTVGFYNAGKGSMHWKDSVKSILHMPTIYAIPLAFILKALPYRLESFPLWPSFMYIKDGLISIALITLGAQLSKTKFVLNNKEVYISNFVRLIGGPIFAFIIIKLLNIQGVTAQTLMISSAIPTAVNTALIAVERNNHPDYASQTVMTATLFSSITLAIVVYVSRILFAV